jgi:hypothetical protein
MQKKATVAKNPHRSESHLCLASTIRIPKMCIKVHEAKIALMSFAVALVKEMQKMYQYKGVLMVQKTLCMTENSPPSGRITTMDSSQRYDQK